MKQKWSTFPAGWRIAFTGRLASMSRATAIQIVVERGGVIQSRVSHRTDALVIGADGWPLRNSGDITRNLMRAKKLVSVCNSIEIMPEAEFLDKVCLVDQTHSLRKLYTIEELSSLLGVSGLRLRRWVKLGLIPSAEVSSFTPLFDFQHVVAAKMIVRLMMRGVAPQKLVANLRRLERWLPHNNALQSSILALESQLIARSGDSLIDATGQLYFHWHVPATGRLEFAENDTVPDADMLFDEAFSLEQEGHPNEAIARYSVWIEHFGDDNEVLFNLANLYLKNGLMELARRHYHRSVKAAEHFAPAWNNLGLCLYSLNDISGAITALRQALELSPDNVDAIFNLADILDEVDSLAEAQLLWHQIIQHCACSAEVKNYAVARLAASCLTSISTS